MANEAYLIVDIGSTKVISVVANKNQNGVVNIHGVGKSAVDGIAKGSITNIDNVASSVKQTISHAISTTSIKITKVYVCISSIHSIVVSAEGAITISGGGGEIELKDIEQVLKMVYDNSLKVTTDRSLIHLFPKYFDINDEVKTKNPLSNNATRLGSVASLVFAKNHAIKNINTVFKRCEYSVDGFVLSAYASSYSLLNKEDKENGALVIDIGGGVSEVALFHEGVLVYCDAVAFGGNAITNDLHKALNITVESAEIIKKQYGVLILDENMKNASVPLQNGNSISIDTIKNHIHARVEEILLMIKSNIEHSELLDKISFIVLTGGTSNIKGIDKLCELIFNKKTKIANIDAIRNSYTSFDDNSYSVINGMIYYFLDEKPDFELNSHIALKQPYICKQDEISKEHKIEEEIIIKDIHTKKETGHNETTKHKNIVQKFLDWFGFN